MNFDGFTSRKVFPLSGVCPVDCRVCPYARACYEKRKGKTVKKMICPVMLLPVEEREAACKCCGPDGCEHAVPHVEGTTTKPCGPGHSCPACVEAPK